MLLAFDVATKKNVAGNGRAKGFNLNETLSLDALPAVPQNRRMTR